VPGPAGDAVAPLARHAPRYVAVRELVGRPTHLVIAITAHSAAGLLGGVVVAGAFAELSQSDGTVAAAKRNRGTAIGPALFGTGTPGTAGAVTMALPGMSWNVRPWAWPS